ncbi:MAG: DUF4082 domain-containing protein [Pseudobdellovibrionaceae bacterium]
MMKTYGTYFATLLMTFLFARISHAACDQTLSTGSNIASAVSSAPNGSTICLNSGNYGSINFWNIARSGFVTLQSASGTGAAMSPSIGNSKFIKFSNMTLNNTVMNNCSTSIHFLNSVFSPHQGGLAIDNRGCSVTNQDILVDGVKFDQVHQATWEGRLSISGAKGMTIRNSTFSGVSSSGASDGIQIIGGSTNVTVGPNNTFSGILQALCGSVHCDNIQDYGGGPNNKIIGNHFINGDFFIMMPDGSSTYTVTDNVFDGRASGNIDKIQFGSAASPIFRHNTIRSARVSFDSKSGMSASSNVQAQNNIMMNGSSWKTTNGSGCSNCTFTYNLYDSSSIQRGTNNLSGTPSFVGGTSPSGLSGYQLASSSVGYKAGSDGLDMGITSYGSGSTPPPPVSLAAPSNLRIVSLAYNQAKVQWDYTGSGQSGFIVNRKAASGAYAQAGTVSASTLSYTDSSVSASTAYCYQVKAYNASSQSALSNEICSTTPAQPTTPPPPSGTGQNLFGAQVPAQQNLNDGVAYELGMRFTATASGKITAIRYFRGSSESGTRTGKIYSSSGATLATVTFPSSTTTGWQQATLSSPLNISANTEYTVAVNTGGNFYVATTNGMASQIANGNLRSVVGSNGVYGPVGSRPTNSYQNSNYFRDIVFVADSSSSPSPGPVASTIIVDNLAPGASSSAVSFTGKWCTSSLGPYYGIASVYSCSIGTTTPDTYTLRPNVTVAQPYDVYIQYTSYSNRGKAVAVNISHAGGIASKTIDQTINGSQFVLLGRYSFNVGTAGYVKISHVSSSSSYASIDAIRLVPVP